MHEAGGLNKKILEHSSSAELVFVTMPPIPAEHNTGKISPFKNVTTPTDYDGPDISASEYVSYGP